MQAYWVTMENGATGCAYAESEAAARALAEKRAGGKTTVKKVETLPYPASPRLDALDGWGKGQHPSFCYDPKSCAGRSSCPKSYACSE